MNKTETLAAAEIMRRAAEGEFVLRRDKKSGACTILCYDAGWNWKDFTFELLDFPSPPPNSFWHNPANLNATQVGVHEGWRLCLEGEITPMGMAHTLEVRMGSGWTSWRLELAKSYNTFRTKSPLEVKADPISEAWAHASKVVLSTETTLNVFKLGWHNCKEHYKIP